ncbi:MAG: UPF0175 family protein [Anaerolineae bacterium]
MAVSTLGKAMDFDIEYLVRAGLYDDSSAVIADAMRHLLIQHPEYKVEIAVTAYQAEAISLGKAAEIAGICLEDMKELLRDRGIPLKLGPETKEEALAEIRALEEMLGEPAGRQ